MGSDFEFSRPTKQSCFTWRVQATAWAALNFLPRSIPFPWDEISHLEVTSLVSGNCLVLLYNRQRPQKTGQWQWPTTKWLNSGDVNPMSEPLHFWSAFPSCGCYVFPTSLCLYLHNFLLPSSSSFSFVFLLTLSVPLSSRSCHVSPFPENVLLAGCTLPPHKYKMTNIRYLLLASTTENPLQLISSVGSCSVFFTIEIVMGSLKINYTWYMG